MNVTNATSNEDEVKYGRFKVIVDVYIVGFLCVFGISGNILSIVVIGKDRAMRGTTGFLLQMLAFADAIYLTTCLFYQAFNTVDQYTDWVPSLSEIWTYVEPYIWPCASIAQTGAVWLVVVVTADRYVAICKPLHAPQYSTLTNMRRAVTVVWIFSILYNLPRFFERSVVRKFDNETNATTYEVEKTDLRNNNLYIVVYKTCLFFIVRFFIPLSSLAFFNTRLIQAIKESSRLRGVKVRDVHRKEKYTLTLVVVVLVFVICELPDFILRLWIAVPIGASSMKKNIWTFRYINVISNLFLTINSCVNFVIYCFMGQKFRRILLQVLCQKRRPVEGPNSVRMSVRWDRTNEESTTLVRSYTLMPGIAPAGVQQNALK